MSLLNLMADKWTNGVFVFVLGLLVVFFGITVIVLVISLIGRIMKAKGNDKKSEKTVEQPSVQISESSEEDNGALVAAITAVLAAYYFAEGNDCEFKIKKIKRIY